MWLATPFAPFPIADVAAVIAGLTADVKSPARLVASGTTALVTRPSIDVATFSRAGTTRAITCLIALVWFVRQEEMLVKKPCTEEFPAWRISSEMEVMRLRREKRAADRLLESGTGRSEASALLIF